MGGGEAVGGEVADDDVEEKEAGTAHAGLDVVAEDVEEEQVAEQVHPTAVDEQGGEDGEERRLGEGRGGAVAGEEEAAAGEAAVPELVGDDAPVGEVDALLAQQVAVAGAVGGVEAGGGADEEDEGAHPDEGVGDHGCAADRVLVVHRDDHAAIMTERA